MSDPQESPLRTMWPSQHAVEVLSNLSNLLLILSLGAGVVATIGIAWTASKKEDYLQRELANANLKAAQAIERAEQERLARVKIEERLAPRVLSQEQLSTLLGALQQHRGVVIDILQFGETPEIHAFTAQLHGRFERAAWNPRCWVVTAGGALSGVIVAEASDVDDAHHRAALTVLDTLRGIGVGLNDQTVERFNRGLADWPKFVMGPPCPEGNQAPLRLYVGAKP